MPDARVETWESIAADHPMPLIDRQRIVGEQAMLSRVRLHKGFRLHTHEHANEQMAVVLSGRVRFGLGAEGSRERREVVVSGGQVLVLPANVPHSAEALEDTWILDVFAPPSATTGIDEKR